MIKRDVSLIEALHQQAWNHTDFVRMADQSVLYPSSWKPMVVLQEAAASAFVFRGEEVTLLPLRIGLQYLSGAVL